MVVAPVSNFRFSAASRHGAAALMLALIAGCSSPPPPTFDLSAPRNPGHVGGGGQLAVAEPVAVQAFDSDRVIVKDRGGAISYLAGAQWADRLPKLIQAKLVQTYENAGRVGGVGRPGGGVSADRLLVTEIRDFNIAAAAGEAVVTLTAKIVTSGGQAIAGKVFSARVSVGTVEGPAAAQALDQALGQVMTEIVRWSSGRR
jgi:cholesterol transport system auxiliary component